MSSPESQQHRAGKREVDLYPQLLNYFNNCSLAFAEVPYYKKRIDLVFCTAALKNLYAVEVKIYDWMAALKQAAINQLFAQHSYVALPERTVARLEANEIEMFKKLTVGLISVSGVVDIIVPPKRNKHFHLTHYHMVKHKLSDMAKRRKPKPFGVVNHAIVCGTSSLELLQIRASKRKNSLQKTARHI